MSEELAAKMQRMIARGQVDEHLLEINGEITKRMRYVRALQSYEALASIEPGDRVRIRNEVKPRYLAGQRGTVEEISDRRSRGIPLVLVKLDPGSQWGKYRSGRVLFTAGALEIVEKRTADAAGGEETA